ncbi:hypothetical protein ACLMJK_004377 [Lecanora helva]
MIIRSYEAALAAILADLAFAAQPSAAPPVSAPLRGLPWGQLNFLHTTDTHGWHAGHLREPSFSADWGDYISFAERLHEKADNEGVDLLLIDTGDKIEGNGLYDASRPKGRYTLDIFAQQHIDVICSGNHELYKNHSSYNEFEITVPNFPNSYLASNIDIYDAKTGERRPLAPRYKKFTTKNQGIRILAFGFLYDFTDNSNNTVVKKVEDVIKEKWFQEAIRDRDVDLFLVAGHVSLRSPEYAAIFKAIRGQQWDVPIQFFGGHTHIRDYAKYDKKAYALESGRYMETIGFQSINGLHTYATAKTAAAGPDVKKVAANPSYDRRYIDNNLYSFHQHTGLNATTFPTAHGRNVSAMISTARQLLSLDKVYGCSPQDYWTNRAPFPNENSIFTWLQNEVLPDMIKDPDKGEDRPRMVLTNTGALRFDIFKGPFTVDTTYSVSPFTSGFRYIKDVPFSVAKRLLQILNQEVPQLWDLGEQEGLGFRAPIPREKLHISEKLIGGEAFYRSDEQQPLAGYVNNGDGKPDLTPGYTTTDDAGSSGDDTVHSPIKYYRVPNCIESRIDFPPTVSPSSDQVVKAADPASVDLIYVDFIEKYVLLALRFLGTDYKQESTEVYMEGRDLTGVIAEWVGEHWKCE